MELYVRKDSIAQEEQSQEHTNAQREHMVENKRGLRMFLNV